MVDPGRHFASLRHWLLALSSQLSVIIMKNTLLHCLLLRSHALVSETYPCVTRISPSKTVLQYHWLVQKVLSRMTEYDDDIGRPLFSLASGSPNPRSTTHYVFFVETRAASARCWPPCQFLKNGLNSK